MLGYCELEENKMRHNPVVGIHLPEETQDPSM